MVLEVVPSVSDRHSRSHIPHPRFLVILPAAGSGTRYGSDKLAVTIGSRTVLEHGIAAFAGRPDVAAVVVAGRDCPGGDCRQATVHRALLHAQDVEADFVAVHDAARPAISQELIDRVFAAAIEHGAAVPGLPVTDTVKRLDAAGFAVETPPRKGLVSVQTPQAFRRDWLTDAFARCPVPLADLTDDAQLVELAGHRVRIVDGDPVNRKLTRPDDLDVLRKTLRGA